MSTNYSAGPWALAVVESDSRTIRHLVPVDAERFSLLTIVESEGTKFAAIYRDEDAHLIAAAPELLEALTKYVTTIKQCGGGDKQLFLAAMREAERQAEAAIAKAMGGAA